MSKSIVSGTIIKWLYQSSSLQTFLIKLTSGIEYKILDFDLLLEGARSGDFCKFTAIKCNDDEHIKYSAQNFKKDVNNTWKIVDLEEFIRPFDSSQIYDLIINTKNIGPKTVNQITNNIDLTDLSKLIQDKNWEEINTKLLSTKLKLDHCIALLKNFQLFAKESNCFSHLVVTNFLIKYKKCQLDDKKWNKCRKMVSKLIVTNGMKQEDLLNYFKTDPYMLILNDLVKADNKHFEILDHIAQYGYNSENWNLELKSRQLSGIWTTMMSNLFDNQDCYLPLDTLLFNSKRLLHSLVAGIEQKLNKIIIYQLKVNGKTQKIAFPDFIDKREKFIVGQMGNFKFNREIDCSPEKLLEIDNELDEYQIEIIQKIILDGRGIIMGPPGVGKTRIIRAITSILSNNNEKIILSAPTGLACKNIAKNIIEHVDVYTVAKLIYTGNPLSIFDDDYNDDGDNGIVDEDSIIDDVIVKDDNVLESTAESDIKEKYTCLLEKLLKDHNGIIIDEASMLDINQFYYLFNYLPLHNFRFILVGDPNQLPSIGPGQVFFDLIKSGLMPCYKLSVNYRQKQGSKIISNAIKIMNGDCDLETGNDFKTAQTSSDQETINLINGLLEHIKKKDGELEETIILTPYSKQNYLASINMNKLIKNFFNPKPIKSWGTFSVGDRVMQTKNVSKKQIVNGDIGYIIDIKTKNGTNILQYLIVEYAINDQQKIKIKYNLNEAREQLTLAYAISIHKSQGNGYKTVIIVVPQIYNNNFFNRNMIYTAITRAKKHLYVIGGNIGSSIQTPLKPRKTRLCARLKKITQPYNIDKLCLICQKETNQMTILKCQHQFCQNCIQEWMLKRTNCPICKIEV